MINNKYIKNIMLELPLHNNEVVPQSVNELSQKKKIKDYSYYMDQIGFTSMAWIIFTLASFLQFIWGQEACFISINIDFLGKSQKINQQTISLCVCLLYSMMGIGSALVGILTKNFGRIITLHVTILIHLIATVLCSSFMFGLNFYVVLVFRCINNIAIGIFNIVVLNLMSEFFPTKNRCLVLMINSGFYNLGNLYTILINNALLDLDKFNSLHWRIVNYITLIPGIFSMFILTCWGSESPLYLLNKNRQTEGFAVLENMSQRRFTDEEKAEIITSISSKKNYKLKSNYSELFISEYIILTISSLIICSICYLNMIGISYLIPKTLQSLKKEIYNVSYNTQIFIYGVIQLPNGFIGGFMTENKFFGRKKTIWFSALMCALFYFISAFWMKYVAIYAGMIMLFNSICFGCGFIYVTEVFPTNLRDQAQSFIQCFSFLLGSWSPYVVDAFTFKSSYIFFGVTNLVCIIVTFILPVDTLLRPLDEDL